FVVINADLPPINSPPPSPWKLRALVDRARVCRVHVRVSLEISPSRARVHPTVDEDHEAGQCRLRHRRVVSWCEHLQAGVLYALRVAGRREPSAFRAGWRPPHLADRVRTRHATENHIRLLRVVRP